MMNSFVLGCAYRIITPPIGTLLYGYPNKRPADKVNDDLRCNVMTFGYGKPDSVLISMDLCSFPEPVANRLADEINSHTNIAKEKIAICATHTHSGPCLSTIVGWGDFDTDYFENTLIKNMLDACDEAINSAKEVLLGVASTDSYVGINRREILPNGQVTLGQNQWGAFDPTMTVLSFIGKDDKKPFANLIHYGCHGTAAGHATPITRDWSGIMVDRLTTETGAFTMYVNGAEGDVGPRLSNGKTVGDISLMTELGGIAATDAVKAFKKIKTYRDVNYSVITDEIKLPYKPFPSIEEMEAKVEAMGDPEKLWPMSQLVRSTLLKRIEAVKKGEFKSHMVINQVIFAFNDVAIVPFGFEVFSEIFLRLKKYSPFENTLGISNSNAANAYLPSLDQIPRGGYEVTQFTGRNVYALADNTDDNIINENIRLIEMLLENGHIQ